MAGSRSQRPQKPRSRSVPPTASPRSKPSPSQLKQRSALTKPVKVQVIRSRRNRFLTPLLTFVLLITMGGTVALGGWVAVMLIVNPGSVSGLAWLLPEWNRTPLSRYQSLAEIRSEAEAAGLTVGTVLPLAAHTDREQDELLIPILATPCDRPTCQEIIELRVYRPHPGSRGQLELIERLNIRGPQELFVLAPLTNTPATSGGTARSLPLTQVSIISGATAPGLWLNLRGEWARGSNRTSYGLVVRYDPTQHRLQSLLPWTSPAGADPKWQQVTGSAAPELVVDETIGLAPSFKIYQPIATQQLTAPLRMAAISLDPPALKQVTFVNGLRLAQQGLWTPALQLLKTVQNRGEWSTAAQAQLDVVAFHAAVTKAQADRNWANPHQAIAANLIDGRWARALQLLQSALANGSELTDLLAADGDRIAARVEAALSINANQSDVQAWGTLVQFVKHGRGPALQWLAQHNRGVATLVSNRSMAIPLRRSAIDPSLQAVLDLLNDTLLVADHSSRLVGTASPIANPQASDWLWPQSPATLPPNQSWYRIRVSNFFDGQGWRRSASELNLQTIGRAQQLWSSLGLTTDASIQLIRWGADHQPQTIEATIKATQVQDGQITLLAAVTEPPTVEPTETTTLALTTATVHWLTPPRQTLSELSQQQPVWAEMMLPTLQQAIPETSLVASTETVLQATGDWSVQLFDLTGNQQLDAIVTLPRQTRPATVIFSDQGRLIYSELGREAGQSLAAIADLGEGKAALLVERDRGYTLRQWSPSQARFE